MYRAAELDSEFLLVNSERNPQFSVVLSCTKQSSSAANSLLCRAVFAVASMSISPFPIALLWRLRSKVRRAAISANRD
jgi:hypothetical protein